MLAVQWPHSQRPAPQAAGRAPWLADCTWRRRASARRTRAKLGRALVTGQDSAKHSGTHGTQSSLLQLLSLASSSRLTASSARAAAEAPRGDAEGAGAPWPRQVRLAGAGTLVRWQLQLVARMELVSRYAGVSDCFGILDASPIFAQV